MQFCKGISVDDPREDLHLTRKNGSSQIPYNLVTFILVEYVREREHESLGNGRFRTSPARQG
jgi:hypothetical protein